MNKWFRVSVLGERIMYHRQKGELLSYRVIVRFNRNLPTRCHKTSLRAFVSWIAGMALRSLTCRMLCAYSIRAPIGAGLISREKHYHPLWLKNFCTFQPCNVTDQSSCECSMPKFNEQYREKEPVPTGKCDPDLMYHPFKDHRETNITEVRRVLWPHWGGAYSFTLLYVNKTTA